MGNGSGRGGARRCSLLLASIAVAAACGGSVPLPDRSPDAASILAPVRWGVFRNYQPVFIADEKGYFRDAGLRVDLVGEFTSGPAVVQAASTGNVDAGHSASSGIINAVAAGVPVVGIADSQTEFADAPLMQWYVLEQSSIKTASDLAGRRVGVNSLSGSFYYTVLLFLDRNHVQRESVHFVVVPHHNQEQALRTGQIDVAGLIDPYSVRIERMKGVRKLFRAVDVLGENQFSLVFFRTDFVQAHPESVRAFIRAYRRAIDFITTRPREASETMARRLGIDADLSGVHRYTPGGEVRLADAQFWIQTMRANGELKDGGRLTAQDVARTDFAAR